MTNLNIKKIGAFLLTFALMLIPLGQVSMAANSFDKPVYAYGESLTKSQVQETAKLLSVKDDSIKMRVNINEMNSLLHDTYPYHQVYSSVYIEPLEDGKGVRVKIATPSTITSITELQYANAAITAGAGNVEITVASVKAVDGSGALAGVYKAFQGTSGALPEANVKAAQEELNVTSRINKENQGKEGYSDDVLNAAIAEIKAKIGEVKVENNGTINNVQIGEIVNNIITNYNLDGILTDENKASLENFMNDFSKLELTQEQKDSLKEFGNKLLDEGGKLMDSVKSAWDEISPETKSKGLNIFQSIFQSIYNFFSSFFAGIFK